MPSKPYQPPVQQRMRLIRRLEAAAQKPAVLVQAGAGYGKTTAVRQFLEYKQLPYLYITLKEIHNLIEVLWGEFLQHISQLHPAFANRYKRIQIPSDSANYAIFVRELHRIMESIGPLYFVLDDYHNITGSPANRFILNVIREQVPNLHAILITRSTTGIDLDDLAAAGLVETVSAADLSFSPEEQAAFLAPRAGGLRMETLYRYTEGWPFAIRLLYHTLAPGKPLQYSMEDIRPFMAQLMDKEFFGNYPPEVQKALVRLALPDTLRTPMLGLLTGGAPVEKLLEESPFISHGEGDTLHFHSLYQDFLRSRAGVLTPEEAASTHFACAQWLQRHSHPFEAMNSFRACGDYRAVWAMVAQLLHTRIYPMPSRSMATHCLKILEETPPEVIREDPTILLYGALLRLCAGNTTEAKALAGRFLSISSNAASGWQGEAHLLYGIALFIQWDAAFATHMAKAHSLLPERSRLIDQRFLLMYLTPLFSPPSLAAADVAPLLAALKEGLGHYTAVTGNGAGILETICGTLHYYKGQYAQALTLFACGTAKAEAAADHDTLLNLLFYSIHCCIATGSYTAALRHIGGLKSYSAQDPGAEALLPFADYSLIYFDSLLARKPFSKPTQTPGTKGFPEKAGGRNASSVMLTLLAQGEYREALETMQTAVEILRQANNHFPACYCLGLGSYAALQLGFTTYSHLLLEEAYHTANDGEYTTTFVQGGHYTLGAVAAYRQNPNPKVPAAWLEKIEALTHSWLHNLSQMSELYRAAYPE